jgi:hypothetical protein
MKWVLICAIVAGTLLMMISIISPFIIVALIHTTVHTSIANQTGLVNTVDKLASTPRDVLPLATGLVGFAGGVVTAMFRASTTTGQATIPGQDLSKRPIADDKKIETKKETDVEITLTGTSTKAGDMLKFSLVGRPQNGSVSLGKVSNVVTYTPQKEFTGTDTFTYKVTDAQGIDSLPATVTITVKPPA